LNILNIHHLRLLIGFKAGDFFPRLNPF